MLDLELALPALHTRAATLSVATTGSTTLAATATGYSRPSGSFVTDGFAAGMQVTPTGFTQTTRGVITAVTALTMTIDGGRTVQASGSGRTLSVGLPSLVLVAEEGKSTVPTVGQPYLIERFLQNGSRNRTMPASLLQEDWLAVFQWAFLRGYGATTMRRTITKLKALFVPGGAFTLSDGTVLLIRGDVAVTHSEPLLIDGFAVVDVKIPLRCTTATAVAA